jgi:hypothetical protein
MTLENVNSVQKVEKTEKEKTSQETVSKLISDIKK